jgi:hypothetical protein
MLYPLKIKKYGQNSWQKKQIKSLEFNPNNKNTIEILKQLKYK